LRLKHILLTLLLFSQSFGADRIAILDFGGEGVSQNQKKSFTNMVRDALLRYPQFEVMEREKFEAIMEEQQIQLSGLCDEDCIVEVGQVAGVQYMVSGDITDVGDNTLVVTARIIDVETSKVMAGQSKIVENTNISALLQIAPELADAIMQQFVNKKGLAAGGYQTIIDDTEQGKLELNLSELGVTLVIDGRSRGTMSKKDIKIQLSPGQHDIRVIKEGFKTQTFIVAIEAKAIVSKPIQLISTGEVIEELVDWSFLTIKTSPDQAMVIIDGIEYSPTFFDDKVAPGDHTLKLSKPLYYSVVKEIELEPGQLHDLSFDLKPNYGSLSIASDPPGASIVVNDRHERQQTPHTVTHLQSGQYELSISLPDYRDHKQTITISDAIETKVNVQMTPAFGWLDLTSNPPQSEVVIDGNVIGVTPLQNTKLPSGEYLLTVRTEFYKDHQEMITIKDGEHLTQDVALIADFGRLSVQGFPVGAKIYIDEEYRGVIPSLIKPIRVGSHKIRIVGGKHYKPHEQDIFISLNDMAGIQANLKELSGSLIVSTNPPGASIRIDGKLESLKTPTTIPKLWLGEHEVVFELDEFAISSHSVTIHEDKREVIRADLERLIYFKSREQAIWRSAVLPGLGQYYEGRGLVGGAYLLGQASLFYMLTNQRSEYDDLREDYLEKRTSYSSFQGTQAEITQLWAEVQTAFDASESNYRNQQITMGLIAGTYLWTIADAWLFMPRRTESNWSTGVSANGKAISAHLQVKLP